MYRQAGTMERVSGMIEELRAAVEAAKYAYLDGRISVSELQSEIEYARKFAAELGHEGEF
jgi:hypothetical protein